MQFRTLAVLAALCVATPASAVDVLFNGTVADTCTLAIPLPGTLRLSTDGTQLASDLPLGAAATVTIVSLGGNTARLSAPTLVSYPVGYTPGSETVQMKFSGLASQPTYSSSAANIPLGILPLTALNIDLRVTNPNGFVQGNYQAKTVLTCS